MVADMLQSGVSWLVDQLGSNVAQTITYRRGAQSVTLNATLGRKLLRIADGAGNTRVEVTDIDVLIKASTLILGGVQVEPQRGDEVIVTFTRDYLHQVLPYGDEPPFRWSDPYRTLLRVHGKGVTFPAPTIISLSPSAGLALTATPVTITGTGFQTNGTTTVTFGALAATSVVVANSTTITCLTPAGAIGRVDVTVTNPDGQSVTDAGGYTYIGSNTDLWQNAANLWDQAAFNWATATVTTPVPKTVTSATLIQWVDAAMGTYQNTTLTTAASADADPVGGWVDQSSFNHTYLQSTAARRPTLKLNIRNGLPVLRFDGVDDFLRAGGDQSQWIGTVTQPTTILFAAKMSSTGNLRLFSQATGGGGWLFRVNGGAWDFQAGADLSGGTADQNWHQFTLTVNGASSSLRIDGSQVVAGDAGSNSQASGFTLSGNENTPVSLNMPMDLGSWLVYRGSMSTADRNAVEAYLKSRWATP